MSPPPPAMSSNEWTVCILAGGQSRRMGREKSRITINGVSLLSRVRAAAQSTGRRTFTVRTDAIPNCGPLSGIYTGLLRARTGWCIFLGCDMPLVSRNTIEDMMRATDLHNNPIFMESDRGYGFPLTVCTEKSVRVEAMIRSGKRSLIQLANELRPKGFKLPQNRLHELSNANTPQELRQLKQIIHPAGNG